MATTTVHLRVEAGPDRGRELSIPEAGGRVGRAAENDIVLSDASLSRFHCRFYFKSDRDLCVSDLASTNETLVNDRPITDIRLIAGDAVTIGETRMRVVCDTLTAPAPAEPVPDALPPEGAPRGKDIDLGLASAPEPTMLVAAARPLWRRLLWPLALTLVIAGAAVAALRILRKPPTGAAGAGNRAPALEIAYERVQAHPKNIFRYAVTLSADKKLAVRIDNLEDGRVVSEEKRCDPAAYDDLARKLAGLDFAALKETYQGVAPDLYVSSDLTLTLGRAAKRVRVFNCEEPEIFQKAREAIENFVQVELKLFALNQPPEKLREMAQEAWLQGKKLLDEKEIRHGNLYAAIQQFTLVERYLQNLEPKPDYYAEAIAARRESERTLGETHKEFKFRIEQAVELREWERANRDLQTLMEILPDRSDERYDWAYKMQIDVQRRLKPNR